MNSPVNASDDDNAKLARAQKRQLDTISTAKKNKKMANEIYQEHKVARKQLQKEHEKLQKQLDAAREDEENCKNERDKASNDYICALNMKFSNFMSQGESAGDPSSDDDVDEVQIIEPSTKKGKKGEGGDGGDGRKPNKSAPRVSIGDDDDESKDAGMMKTLNINKTNRGGIPTKKRAAAAGAMLKDSGEDEDEEDFSLPECPVDDKLLDFEIPAGEEYFISSGKLTEYEHFADAVKKLRPKLGDKTVGMQVSDAQKVYSGWKAYEKRNRNTITGMLPADPCNRQYNSCDGNMGLRAYVKGELDKKPGISQNKKDTLAKELTAKIVDERNKKRHYKVVGLFQEAMGDGRFKVSWKVYPEQEVIVKYYIKTVFVNYVKDARRKDKKQNGYSSSSDSEKEWTSSDED
jgi:hypothetical protein